MNPAYQFEALVCEHYEPLFRFAMSLTRVEADARDLTQHTFHVWATKGHQLRDRSKVKTWLFTTLHRAFLAMRRRENRFPHHDLEEISEHLADPAPEPVSQADCSLVLPALAQVDEVYQPAVALFYLEDCSYKDIAAILDVPIGTVKSRIARGIAQLRKTLLSDGLRGSFLNKDEIPSFARTDEFAASREDMIDFPQGSARLTEADYDVWDFSSTLLREQIPAL